MLYEVITQVFDDKQERLLGRNGFEQGRVLGEDALLFQAGAVLGYCTGSQLSEPGRCSTR